MKLQAQLPFIRSSLTQYMGELLILMPIDNDGPEVANIC
jgi:hypothetical protein